MLDDNDDVTNSISIPNKYSFKVLVLLRNGLSSTHFSSLFNGKQNKSFNFVHFKGHLEVHVCDLGSTWWNDKLKL